MVPSCFRILSTRLLLACVLLPLGGQAALAHPPASERIASLARALAERPDAALYVDRAREYRLIGEFPAARRDCDRALELEPGFAPALTCRADLALDRGHPDEAVQDARLAERSDPTANTARTMARALEALGRTEEAADAWARAMERADPADPGDFLERARLQEKSSTRDALATLDSAALPLGPLPALQAEAVSIARRAGLHEEALLRVDELLRAAPRRETWLAERGRILVDAGRRPEAWAAFSEALAELQALPLPQRNTAAIRALEQELHGHLRSSIGEDIQ